MCVGAEITVVTGASRGIGASVARQLASPQRQLVLMARSQDELEERCREVEALGGRAAAVPVDLSIPGAPAEAIDRVEARYGRVTGMVLNAGVANNRPFRDTTSELIEAELRVNYLAPTEFLKRCLPSMVDARHGAIVVVGSLTSFVPFPGNASYSASKTALLTLVRGLRLEVQGQGIQIGMVLPGLTDTDMTKDHSSMLAPMTPEAVAEAVVRTYRGSEAVVVPGVMNRMAAQVFRSFPGVSDRLLGRMAKYVIPRTS